MTIQPWSSVSWRVTRANQINQSELDDTQSSKNPPSLLVSVMQKIKNYHKIGPVSSVIRVKEGNVSRLSDREYAFYGKVPLCYFKVERSQGLNEYQHSRFGEVVKRDHWYCQRQGYYTMAAIFSLKEENLSLIWNVFKEYSIKSKFWCA